jgi:hypothetical protein
MNEIATIPNPTTTTLFMPGGCGGIMSATVMLSRSSLEPGHSCLVNQYEPQPTSTVYSKAQRKMNQNGREKHIPTRNPIPEQTSGILIR